MRNTVATALLALSTLLTQPALAQTPNITPSLKKMLGALPIPGLQNEAEKLLGALKQTSCGAGLSACYSAQSGPLQLYFFSGTSLQQTLVLVVRQRLMLPQVLNAKLLNVMGDTALSNPIFSISTTEFMLETAKMPGPLQQLIKESYYEVPSISFVSGAQMAARADVGGVLKTGMQALGLKVDSLTLRAGVVMPIPTDLAGGASAGAGMAEAVAHGETMKKAGADAAKPEAFVEFQLAPGSALTLPTPAVTLTDASFYINNGLTLGYKGNARFNGSSKTVLLQFQTPLNPAGALDLLDFSFRMAMPQSFTLEDQVWISAAMAMPEGAAAASATAAALDKLGGGFIGGIKAIKRPLLAATKPLSVFQLRNPAPAPPYKFGDPTQPFPSTNTPFNVVLLGPLASGGPYLYLASDVRILGQTMGKMEVSVGKNGFHGTAEETLTLRLGPLGQSKIKMQAHADITDKAQNISLSGNLAGQRLLIALAGETVSIELSASCVNPFEIKASATIQENLDIAQVFAGQGGANVDPSKLQGCVGRDLEMALNKVANEYKALSGYSADQAKAALNKIQADAAAAYNKAKDEARDLAKRTSGPTMSAFQDAGNALSGVFGKKKKRSDENDKFDRSIFNWDYYYDTRGTAWGKTDLVKYWAETGYANGERASFEFDLKFYRKQIPGVSDKDLVNTWLETGINRCDQASADFSLKALMRRNPGGSCRDNLDWWFERGGMNSGLNARP